MEVMRFERDETEHISYDVDLVVRGTDFQEMLGKTRNSNEVINRALPNSVFILIAPVCFSREYIDDAATVILLITNITFPFDSPRAIVGSHISWLVRPCGNGLDNYI